MKKLILRIVFLVCSTTCFSQENTNSNLEISIITIGPGTALNDAFGHSGIRVKTLTEDVVYDYGRYPFNDPNFYLNFAKGKLHYSQGKSTYNEFLNFYISSNRNIKEQVLNLTETQKKNLNSYLINNYKPENREYEYDFFYNNCATKIRDICQIATQNTIVFTPPAHLKKQTFRQLIQENLAWNSWGSLGIDLALGSVIDKKAKPIEYMFLPEYIFQFFQVATFKNSTEKLVKKTTSIFTPKEEKTTTFLSFFGSPFFIFLLLALFIAYTTYKNKITQTTSNYLDLIIFAITGSIGIVILALWFATNHTATAFNYNFLWAFPLNIIMLFFVFKKQPKIWFSKYFKLLILLLALVFAHWLTGVQRFAVTLYPIFIALLLRYVFLVWNNNRKLDL